MGAAIQVSHGGVIDLAHVTDHNTIPGLSVDVRENTFTVTLPARVEITVLQADVKNRHLLMMARDTERGVNQKFLCGLDERDWFVASVPSATISVEDAKQRLMPPEARQSQIGNRVKASQRHRRHNRGFIRQGEWFFIPAHTITIDAQRVLRNEPLSRGGKPHWVEQLYRTGGESVQVHAQFAPEGITRAGFGKLSEKQRRTPGWQSMKRNPAVYARGKVRHPDHKTIRLHDWHLVRLNREQRPRSLAFLD